LPFSNPRQYWPIGVPGKLAIKKGTPVRRAQTHLGEEKLNNIQDLGSLFGPPKPKDQEW
jgi:hypothetical protein